MEVLPGIKQSQADHYDQEGQEKGGYAGDRDQAEIFYLSTLVHFTQPQPHFSALFFVSCGSFDKPSSKVSNESMKKPLGTFLIPISKLTPGS